MELARVLENKEEGKLYGLMGNINITTNHQDYYLVTNYHFSGTVKDFLKSSKAAQSLKIVMLDSEYLTKTVANLTDAEIKKIALAKALIENKKVIVLDYFEKGLSHKEKDEFKRLFKKLTQDYHKTFIIYTNDLTFIWDNTESIFYIADNLINEYTSKEYFNLLEYVNKPIVSQIIDLIRDKNIKIEDYKYSLDLLKAIYRLKENK